MIVANKLNKLAIGFLILVISALSTWRTSIILGMQPSSGIVGLLAWPGLGLGFILFWLAVLAIMRYFRDRRSPQQLLTATLGALIFGLFGLFLLSPAGLSRLTLELYAKNVWSPNIFTVTWEDDGLWDAPLTLPTGEAIPGTLEIIAAEADRQTSGREVWLVEASRSDGSKLALDEFQAEPGWERREIDWRTYQSQLIWISRQAQGARLSWQGVVSGPITLLFARHDQAGAVTVRWNGREQIFDLYAPNIEFQGVVLAADEAVVWRAELPLSALGKEISLAAQPSPNGDLPLIERINLLGVPGQSVTAAGDELAEALQVSSAVTNIQWSDYEVGRPHKLFLTGPLATNARWSTLIPRLENSLVILYLGVIGGLAVNSLIGRLRPNTLLNLNITLISILVALFVGEFALRMYLPPANKYYVWQPNLHVIFNPYPGVLPGVEGESHLVTNSEGIRGDEFSPEDDYRILTIGGSTTEVLYLDQTEAWPQLLQAKLNETRPRQRFWVGNVGRGGHTTREHIVQMSHLLLQYPDLDAVILLAGVNELFLRLSLDEAYDPNYLAVPGMQQLLLSRAFTILPQQDPNLTPYYQQNAAWRLIASIKYAQAQTAAVAATDIQDSTARNIVDKRIARKKGLIQDQLPDLTSSLDEYRRNINTLIDLAQAHNVRLILMTQPSLWRPDLSQAEQDLLIYGQKANDNIYYSAEALSAGLAAYNQRLLEICAERQVECIDLASALSKDTTIFYDDIHFNESGSEQVANLVADYLLHH